MSVLTQSAASAKQGIGGTVQTYFWNWQATADLPHVEGRSVPGTLGLYEEYADEVADLVLPFLSA